MSVETILQALAENAGRAQLARGALIGNTVANVSQLPAQIIEDRARQAILLRNQAIQNEQLGFQRHADARAQADQATQDQATKAALTRKAIVNAGLQAAVGDSGDPTAFDARAALEAVTKLGDPSAIRDVIAAHREMQPKFTRGAAGSVSIDEQGLPVPGSAIPEKKPDYTVNGQRFSGDTNQPLGPAVAPQVTPSAAQTHNMRLEGVGDVPVDYVPNKDGSGGSWMYQGQDVSGKVKAIPSAAIQVLNQMGTADKPSATAKAIAEYRIPPPSSRTLASPAGEMLMSQVMTANPDYKADLFSVRAPTRKAYTTGTQGQQLTAMNTAIEHLDQLQAAADALKNGDFKPGNAAYNYLKDTFGVSTPTTFAAIKEKVDKELDAVASKGVPTVSGAAAQKAIGGANSSPESIKAYIDASISLMGSGLNALKAPYQRVMGDNDPFDPLTPQAKSILLKRGFDPTQPTNAGPSTAVGAKPTAEELIKKYGG